MVSRRGYLKLVGGTAASASLAGQAVAKDSDSITVKEGITYRETPEQNLELELYLPANHEWNATIVFAHGGGWRTGGLGQFKSFSKYMAKQGYACANILYRLSDVAQYPAAVKDFKAAIKWLRANAVKYKIDENRIAAAGGSAGGHLAALASTLPNYEPLEPDGFHEDISSDVQAAVLFNGVYDLTIVKNLPRTPPNVLKFLGGTYEEIPDVYKEASPVRHISSDDPPTLILHGTNDRVVPYPLAKQYRNTLQEQDIYSELFTAEGAGHGFFNGPPWKAKTLTAMEEFLEGQMPNVKGRRRRERKRKGQS